MNWPFCDLGGLEIDLLIKIQGQKEKGEEKMNIYRTRYIEEKVPPAVPSLQELGKGAPGLLSQKLRRTY